MQHQESTQSCSGEGCGWGFWLLTVLALSSFFPALAFVGFLLGLLLLCAVYRWASILLGLTLVVGCVILAFVILSDPKIGDSAETVWVLVPWAGFGLWLAARGFSKKRGLTNDP
ncbi:MAG: hypothetical protein NT154_34245 [Verrucomicrobia bacterium]|nr:hypothetical protein [Verrucomicrobiota bacterium]